MKLKIISFFLLNLDHYDIPSALLWVRLPFTEESDFCSERNAVFQVPETVYGKREEKEKSYRKYKEYKDLQE